MCKRKTSAKQKKSGTKYLKAHVPFASKELKNRKLVVDTLLDCIKNKDLESFQEVLVAHLMTMNKTQLAKKIGIGRRTLYDLMDPKKKFNPELSTISSIIHPIAAWGSISISDLQNINTWCFTTDLDKTVAMKVENLSKSDFDQIILELEAFWGSRAQEAKPSHHPIYLYEFGNTSYVIRDGKLVAAYLFGFESQTSPTGYVHLIGVRESHRKQKLGTVLYQHFMDEMKKRGCKKIKAITTSGNKTSINFHQSLGMILLGEPNDEGISVVRDYFGKDGHRVVFEKSLS